MERPSIVGSGNRVPQSSPVSPDSEAKQSAKPSQPGPLRFPGDDGGQSLNDMALRDLAAALQLLAERAQYITGATGAAIALLDGENMVCRASAGSSAPEIGAHLQVNAGLSGESVRTRQVLRCNDAENDPRVNRESCRSLGIVSVVVLPLIRETEVNGIFELMADRVNAFDDRDIVALQRLGEMIHTAVEHAEAAQRAPSEITGKDYIAIEDEEDGEDTVLSVGNDYVELKAKPAPILLRLDGSKDHDTFGVKAETQLLAGEPAAVRRCAGCGFPVSGARSLCLDCEKGQTSGDASAIGRSDVAPKFLSEFDSGQPQESWLRSHLYLVATVLIVAGTVLLLLLHRI